MGRAENGRIQKESRRKLRTYTLNEEQIKNLKREVFEDAVAEAMKLMLTIPLEVLITDYWPKSAAKKTPGFVQKVLNLYEQYEQGTVSMESLVDDLWTYGGVRFETVREEQ